MGVREMKIRIIVIIAAICGTVISASAASEGVKAVVERRQTMRHIERPVRSIKQGDAIVSVYADDTIKTNAVRMMRMSEATKAKVEKLVDDKETLAAARKLAAKLRGGKHAQDVADFTDADLVAVADEVLDTSKKDQATAGAIGAAIAAAAAAALKKGKNKKEKSA